MQAMEDDRIIEWYKLEGGARKKLSTFFTRPHLAGESTRNCKRPLHIGTEYACLMTKDTKKSRNVQIGCIFVNRRIFRTIDKNPVTLRSCDCRAVASV